MSVLSKPYFHDERAAREHDADLSEEGFNEALRKVGRQSPNALKPNV